MNRGGQQFLQFLFSGIKVGSYLWSDFFLRFPIAFYFGCSAFNNGITSGLQAVETIQAQGFTIFGVGMVVTILPMLITMLFGRYILNYDNTAILAGALSGSRSANPAFGEVLDKAENSIPTVPFAITYALANVFLTLLGPLIVAFV